MCLIFESQIIILRARIIGSYIYEVTSAVNSQTPAPRLLPYKYVVIAYNIVCSHIIVDYIFQRYEFYTDTNMENPTEFFPSPC